MLCFKLTTCSSLQVTIKLACCYTKHKVFHRDDSRDLLIQSIFSLEEFIYLFLEIVCLTIILQKEEHCSFHELYHDTFFLIKSLSR